MPEPVRYYMDEHVPRAVSEGLRRRGIDVVTTQEAGLLSADDDVLLAYATRHGRVMCTQDADHLRLAAAQFPHAGIIYAPQGTPIGVMVQGPVLISEVFHCRRDGESRRVSVALEKRFRLLARGRRGMAHSLLFMKHSPRGTGCKKEGMVRERLS